MPRPWGGGAGGVALLMLKTTYIIHEERTQESAAFSRGFRTAQMELLEAKRPRVLPSNSLVVCGEDQTGSQ